MPVSGDDGLAPHAKNKREGICDAAGSIEGAADSGKSRGCGTRQCADRVRKCCDRAASRESRNRRNCRHRDKRSENIQKILIAITAITSATLERLGLTTTTDLASVVPGLVLQTSLLGTNAHLRRDGRIQILNDLNPSKEIRHVLY